MKKIYFVETDSKYFINNRIELAKFLKINGFQVYISTLIYTPKDIDYINNEGLIYISSKDNNLKNSAIFILKNIFTLKPELVHIFTISAIVRIGWIAILRKKTNYIFSITGLGYTFISNSLKARLIRIILYIIFPLLTIRKNSKFIVQNKDDFELISKIFFFNNIYLKLIIGSGVDVTKFYPSISSNEIPNILFAARLLFDKGINEYIEAINILKANSINANFFIVGEIDINNPSSIDLNTFNLLIKNNKDIIYEGYINNMDIYLKKIDLVCLPSYREGLSKFLLEAAACGLPIITTDVPGCKEVVENNHNGIIVKTKNSIELADALKTLILNPELRKTMGLNSRKKAVKEFSIEKIVMEFLLVYNETIN